MSYATYSTDALVCGHRDSYTSDRGFRIFTRDAGMLWANARSVREEKSKQRQALVDFSLIRISLVRGKSGWRIGSVESQSNPFMQADTRAKRGAVKQVVALLCQLVHGEMVHAHIYDDVERVLQLINCSEESAMAPLIEVFTVRLLYHLGYIVAEESFANLLEDDTWEQELLVPDTVNRAIERGMQASHL